MSRRALAALLALAAAAALGAVAATFVVGARLFEETVVPNPYEAGLRYGSREGSAAGGAAAAPCDLSAGRCEARLGEGGSVAISLEIEPRPVRAMADLTFTAVARRGPLPVLGAEGEIALSMPGMYMGENRIRLAGMGGGLYRGKGVVVRCPSGGRSWTAAVTLRPPEPGAAPLRATFALEIAE